MELGIWKLSGGEILSGYLVAPSGQSEGAGQRGREAEGQRGSKEAGKLEDGSSKGRITLVSYPRFILPRP